MRVLLKKTKKNLHNYGTGLYKFKNEVNNANSEAQKMGYGFNDRNFYNMEKVFSEEHKHGGSKIDSITSKYK